MSIAGGMLGSGQERDDVDEEGTGAKGPDPSAASWQDIEVDLDSGTIQVPPRPPTARAPDIGRS